MENQVTEGYAQVPPMDVLAMVKIVWFGKWLIAATTVMMIGIGTYYAIQMTGPLYAARVTLQVEPAETVAGSIAGPSSSDVIAMNTQASHLTSDAVLKQVIAEQNLLSDPEFNRYLAASSPISPNQIRVRLRQLLTATEVRGPTDSEVHQKTLQNLRAALNVVRPEQTYLFEVTARSRDEHKAMVLANVVAETFLSAQRGAIGAQSDAAIDWLSERTSTLRAQLARQDQAVVGLMQTVQIHEDAALDRIGTAVLALDQEQSAMIVALGQLRANDIPATSRQTAEIRQLQTRIADTRAHRGRLQDQLNTQSAGMLALQQLQRDADATRALHQSFDAQLQEAKIQQALARPVGRVVTPASASEYVGIRKTLIVKVSALLGLMLGVLAVILHHNLRSGVYHTHQLAQVTGRTVLGQIPDQLTRRRASFAKHLFARQASQLSTALRHIRAGLILQTAGSIPQVIMVTASGSGESATEIAIGLAQDIGIAQACCCLIVVDPSGKEFRRHESTTSTAHSARAFNVIKLDGAAHLMTDAFRTQMQTLRETKKHVVILAPPVTHGPETLLGARFADHIILATAWGKQSAKTICNARDLLESATDNPIALVLTQTRTRQMHRYAAITGSPVSELQIA